MFMEAGEETLAARWFGTVPLFAGVDPQEVRFRRLSSLTNVAFRADVRGVSYCLRVPGRGTGAFIDRAAESDVLRLTAGFGLSPEVVFFDPVTGLMVSRFIEGATTMSRERFAADSSAPGKAARLLRRLHRQDVVFPRRFGVFALIEKYLAVIEARSVRLPELGRDVLGMLPRMREALEAAPVRLVPCHCDPICENFLDDGGRLWIVDWEYAGMNDPMWDLGDLSAEAMFTPAQEEAMLAAYFEDGPSEADRGRVVLYKALSELLWGLWGFMREDASTPEMDYRAYGERRLGKSRELISGTGFDRSLAAVR